MKIIFAILFVVIAFCSIEALPADTDVRPPPKYSRYPTMDMSKKPEMETPKEELEEDADEEADEEADEGADEEAEEEADDEADDEPDTGLSQSLQSMSFDKLIKNAWKNSQNIASIAKILISKFQINKKRITIVNKYSAQKYQIDDDCIWITNLKLAKKFIKNFGRNIIKLTYDGCSFPDHNKSSKLFKLINKKCTNVRDVDLPTNWGPLVKTPFKSVRIAAIMGLVMEPLDLNKIFPNLEELRMNGVMSEDAFVIDRYPNLKNLTYKFGDRADPLIEQIFQKNPQITSYEPREYLSLNFMRKVSLQLPNLETLYWYPYRQQFTQQISPIRYRNLKYLFVRNWEEFSLPNFPLVFENLQSLTYYQYNSQQFNDDWLKAISNNKNLMELAMPETKLTTNQLIDYSKRFTNLKNLEFSFSQNSLNVAFIQFLSNADLESISITHVPVTVSRDTLTMNLPSKWKYVFVNEMPSNGMGTLQLTLK